MYDAIIIGGFYVPQGMSLGPYRLRTEAERAGFSVKVIEHAWDFTSEGIVEYLSQFITEKTKILGISINWLYHLNETKWLNDHTIKLIKEKYTKVKIILGASHYTNIPELTPKYIDYYVWGFGEVAFLELIKGNYPIFEIHDGYKMIRADTYYVKPTMDIDNIFKKEDGFKSNEPIAFETARGCIFSCEFCTEVFIGKKKNDYIRDVDNMAEELIRNYDLFGTHRYILTDPTLNDSVEKLERILRAIEKSKIDNFECVSYVRPELLVTKPEMIGLFKQMGLKGTHFGIESLNNKSRKIIKKGMDIERVLDASRKLRESGCSIHATFIMGLPHDTIDDFFKWHYFLEKNIDTLYQSWIFHPLGVGNEKDNVSGFTKTIFDHGYTITGKQDTKWLSWKRTSDGLTYDIVCDLVKNINSKSMEVIRYAGWTVANGWMLNLPDDVIYNQTLSQSGYFKKLLEYKHNKSIS